MTNVIGPIVRALNVLRAMNHQPQSSLLSLHHATGLPKSTIHRLLMTLKSEGYVRADVVKGTYSLTEKVRCLSEGFTEYDLVVEVGAPILLKTTRATGLPLAIGVLDRGQIVVRYSSMPYSPIGSTHTTVGNTHDLMQSGMGQAYMAFCGDAERERLMLLLKSTFTGQDEWSNTEAGLQRMLTAARHRGYGFRKSERRGASATIAVPLLYEDRMLGVLSLTTFGALLTSKTIHECLALLEQTQSAICSAVSARLA